MTQQLLFPEPEQQPVAVTIVEKTITPVIGRRLRVLDLFCGWRGWSKPFIERGHEVVGLDYIAKFKPDICADILTVPDEVIGGGYDVILASPPCDTFSVASIGKYWHQHDKSPKNDRARNGIEILRKTLAIIDRLKPTYYVIENPRGMMRKMPEMQSLQRHTVTYCQYGEKRMKPTDLWYEMPEGFVFKEPCAKRAPCHVSAPRGSTTGTQGMGDAAAKAIIPYPLALEVCLAVEKSLLTTNPVR
jgi:hypothetical protein